MAKIQEEMEGGKSRPWDDDDNRGDRAFVNQILRSFDIDKSLVYEFAEPPSNLKDMLHPRWGRLDKDHFLEIQHAVNYLFDSGVLQVGGLASVPVGYFMDLAYMLGRPENRLLLPQTLNAAKKTVKPEDYKGNKANDALIKAAKSSGNDYLGLYVRVLAPDRNKAPTRKTVEDCVRGVVYDMANRTTAYDWLTRRVGQYFASALGWPELKPKLDVSMVKKDFDLQGPWRSWSGSSEGSRGGVQEGSRLRRTGLDDSWQKPPAPDPRWREGMEGLKARRDAKSNREPNTEPNPRILQNHLDQY